MSSRVLTFIFLASFLSCAGFSSRNGPETNVQQEVLPVQTPSLYKRAWLNNNILFVEVEQTPGFHLTKIGFFFYEQNIYERDFRISSGGNKMDIFRTKIPGDVKSQEKPINWLKDARYRGPFTRIPLEITRYRVNRERSGK